ncbi:MAG: hypothetical protein WBJ68_14095 [Candidatus Dechloromonas phosphoritropha]|jgi:hypothetical protein
MSRLPLPQDICRCLGRERSADRVAPGVLGAGCKRLDACARHVTIRWDRFDGTLHVADKMCLPGGSEHFIAAYAEGQS